MWTDKLALIYGGDNEFEYSFSANINDVKFAGFVYPQELSQTQAR